MSSRIEVHTEPHGATLILFDGVTVAQMTPGNPPTFVDAFIEEITTKGITEEELRDAVDDERSRCEDAFDAREKEIADKERRNVLDDIGNFLHELY